MAKSIECAILRGGTSKAVFLKDEDLPGDPIERRDLILKVFGSPDRRQINGLGGADPLTSKLAIIGRPEGDISNTADLVYTFGQVSIEEVDVDWHSLCGNITSAVGIYAIEEGYVEAASPVTRVRIFNTNLNRHLYVEVPVKDGRPVETGDYAVPGVPGTGSKIDIDFADTAGAATGRLLPTGKPVERVDVAGYGPIDMSLVDIGNAHVFVRASDLDLKGTETASEIDADTALRDRLEAIRGAAAHRMGMIEHPAASRRQSPATPIIGVISPPSAYDIELTGGRVSEEEVDVVSRLQFMQRTHKTYAGTSTVCTGVASRIPGTIVNEATRASNREDVRIGHPAGVIVTETVVEPGSDGFEVRRATLGRTARRILTGTVFVEERMDA